MTTTDDLPGRLRDSYSRIIGEHHLDVPQLLKAAKEIERLRDVESERNQLIRWQAEAVEVLKRWDQVADLVPGSFLVLGANRSACVHAYIDHLRAENRALQRGGE